MKLSLLPPLIISLIYPCILFLGLFLSAVISDETKSYQKDRIYLLRSSNIINEIFAYNGNLVWFILFSFVASLQIYIRSHTFILLPHDIVDVDSKENVRAKLLKEYMVKFLLKVFILFVCFLIIDNIFILTGGSCAPGGATRSAEQCKALGGDWLGGFDISGHFCFLTNISLILWIELHHYSKYTEEEELQSRINKWIKRSLIVVEVVLYIWMFLLLVTSIYYHTILEKILGCIMGYACPLVMYWLIPNQPRMKSLLYAF
ncbi:hypothetical protein KAFR_0C01860 [Kazachstania africana CBS 2517]|uniref:Acyl-coenzyme A diphosphatase YFT2 n=1 Tax=Kazachstania africana (strain ATCC 22294 / BCRC 22015 / CBS 2517 / CECT 1963 / NBRC 1671 / NRRL Y-8276) TaxID=1071382 RepID=H2AS29_KAZAF|nr:hypothetical protein KAFR_0C01860 [Kazachstania africana CBS 2517]CCF57179.1 hypothetical protein KAFR_0C01860 [Kazachstania africana CBS 2517]